MLPSACSRGAIRGHCKTVSLSKSRLWSGFFFLRQTLGRVPLGAASSINPALFSTNASSNSKIALVLGSSGALGSCVSRYLGRDLGMLVLGADVVEVDREFNESDWELDGFVKVPNISEKPSVEEITTSLALGVDRILEESEEIDAIVVASGGWQGDPQIKSGNYSSSEEIFEGSKRYGETMDRMLMMNLYPVLAAGFTAQQFMANNGLFVCIGATAALSATPGMMAYGIAKAGSHHLVQTMGACTGKSLTPKAKRNAGRRTRRFAENMDTMACIGILPTTIDTVSNRQAMPDGDFSTWTKPGDIATQIGDWVKTPDLRPHSGSLVKVSSSEAGSSFDLVR